MGVWIEAVLARGSDTGVVTVHDEGPRTRIYRWNLADDTFEGGDSLGVRLKGELADISADGRYFAYPVLRSGYPRLAVSRVPFLEPLAVWECGPETTGAYFLGKGGIVLDSLRRRPTEGQVPGWFDVNVHRIQPLERLDRTGWKLPSLPFFQRIVALSEEEYWKPFGKGHLVRRGSRFLIDGYFTIDLRDVKWAEVDRRGRLVYACGSQLRAVDPVSAVDTLLRDFAAEDDVRDMPDWAREWQA